MIKKIKFSKLALVLFLTVLIWVWANRALDETYSIYNATIVMGRTRPNLWVSFPQGTVIDINEIDVTGPTSRINSIEQIITNDPKKLEFPLIPEQFGIDKAGPQTLDVLEIIKKSNWIQKTGLTVVSCDPCEVVVSAVALTRQELNVQCYDKDGLPKELENAQTVSMLVPPDWRDPARVELSSDEVQRAVKQPISKTPFIILPNGQRIDADKAVEIKLSPQEDMLPKKVENATVVYSFSENSLNRQYKIDVENMSEILNIEVFATPAAKDAYESQWSQVELEIHDDDVDTTRKDEFVRREVNYKLPEEFVRLNQIKLARPKATAQFTVTPLPPAESLP
ncbi:MAG: hypothetical protein P8016_02990 [Sedimentisphaerales bacterium]